MTHASPRAAEGFAPVALAAIAAFAAFFAMMQACTSVPGGFLPTRGDALARYVSETQVVATSCSALATGSFLAEVRAGRANASFQMEGAWQSSGTFEAQFLSPLGEAWAQFQIFSTSASGSAPAQARFGPMLAADQKERLTGFIDTLATIGSSTLRGLTCGSGLLPTEGAKVFSGPQGQVLVVGSLVVAGHSVDLESVRDGDPRGGFSIASKVSAGLWKKHGGTIFWNGTWGAEGRAKPRLLSIEAEGEHVELTFLDFE